LRGQMLGVQFPMNCRSLPGPPMVAPPPQRTCGSEVSLGYLRLPPPRLPFESRESPPSTSSSPARNPPVFIFSKSFPHLLAIASNPPEVHPLFSRFLPFLTQAADRFFSCVRPSHPVEDSASDIVLTNRFRPVRFDEWHTPLCSGISFFPRDGLLPSFSCCSVIKKRPFNSQLGQVTLNHFFPQKTWF